MPSNQQTGDAGERDVVRLVPCPNCGKKLMQLPKNYPLYDVQCTGCSFRAQVKTNNKKPRARIFGAGWEIMNKVLKSGFMTPSLIVNFRWVSNRKKKQEIRFYPFVPKANLKKHLADIKSRHRKHWMFNYIGLDKLPYFVVHRK